MKLLPIAKSNVAIAIIAFIALLFYPSDVVGQSNTFPNSGNAGSGTTSPTAQLTVLGSSSDPSLTTDTAVANIKSSSTVELMFGGQAASPYSFWLQTKRSPNDGYAYPLVLNPLGGRLGVGTNSPSALFHVANPNGNLWSHWAHSTAATGQNYGILVTAGTNSSDYSFRAQNAAESAELFSVRGDGKVGIGTANPAGRLEILGDTYSLPAPSGITQTGLITRFRDSRQSGDVVLDLGSAAGTGVGAMWLQSTDMRALYANYALLLNPNGGNVGIGTPAPAARLELNAGTTTGLQIYTANQGPWGFRMKNLTATGRGFEMFQYDGGGVSLYNNYGTGALIHMNQDDVNVGIGTTGPNYKLDVNGTINSNSTITANNIVAKYQDVAEWVPTSQQLSAGTVVVLDSTKSNQVISSSVGYDTRVAGVISAQPGIALGEKGEGKVLVATTGRVKIKVDASKSPIQIGDLLVTSDVPGVAMKSKAVNLGGVQIHRPGTLIGKALEPLAKGKGEILVLLSLQ